MAPLIEVPPPNSWRGVRSIAAANAAAVSSSPTRVNPHHLNLQRRPRPLHHGYTDRPVRSGANGLQHARVAKCSDIAALLQLEADLIDAARCIDRKHELQVDCGLRHSRGGDDKHHEQCQADDAAGCGPLSSARPGEGHPATLASRGPRCGDPDLGPTFPLSWE